MNFVKKTGSGPDAIVHIDRDGLPLCGTGRKPENWESAERSFWVCDSCKFHAIPPEQRQARLKESHRIRAEMNAKIRASKPKTYKR